MPQSEPLFSVIIPAFSEPDGLRCCLEALTRQTVPLSDFEVIVVDDGSEPPLEPVVREFDGRLAAACLRVRNAGPAAARNHGARAARAFYLAFTDHDCAPSPGWLAALAGAFEKHPDAMLGGPKQNGLPQNVYSEAHQIASNFAEAWFLNSGGGYLMTNNLAVRREAFVGVGGFNESLRFAHEDREFGARWADAGYPMTWVREAGVAHLHRLTLGRLLRQHFRYGTGTHDFREARRPAALRARVRFEGLRFHVGLVVKPFAEGEGARAVVLSALLVGSQAAYVAGVLAGRTGRRRVAQDGDVVVGGTRE